MRATTPTFCRYELRTKDPDAARAFYADVLPGIDLEITRLPERAAAAGAPSHWLGHVAGDVERALACGAQRVSPAVPNLLRDPLGAVFAVGDAREPNAPVVWHQLNTTDVARARAFYREVFGWSDDAPVTYTDLAATQRGVHAAWLFHFPVADLEAVIAKVKAGGGLVAGVFAIPNTEDRIAVCDDPQGAFIAFRSSSGAARARA